MIGLVGGMLILAIVVAAVIIIVSFISHALTFGVSSGLYCGRCSYPAKGLPENRCPECGADFDEVGLTDRQRGRQWPVIVLVLAWAIASPFALCLSATPIMTIAPQVLASRSMQSWRGPASDAYNWVEVSHESKTRTGWAQRTSVTTITTVEITFGTARPILRLRADDVTGPIAVMTDTAVTYDGPMDALFVAERLAEAFPDADRRLLKREAEAAFGALAAQLNPQVRGPSPRPATAAFRQQGVSSTSTSRGPSNLVALVVLMAIVAIWALGILFIIRWDRKRP